MSDRKLEEMSALMDGEATDLEVRRVLRNMEQDQALCHKWSRYQMVSAVLKGETHGQATQWQAVDLSARLARALENEDCHKGVPGAAPKKGFNELVIKPFANVAVAASVSAAVILGWQSFNNQSVSVSGPVASASAPGAQLAMAPVNTAGSPLMTVSQSNDNGYRMVPVIPRQDIIRYNPQNDDELNDYLISHSGNAAFNTAYGVAPYARVVGLKPLPAASAPDQAGK